jgi:hypothetical protein
MHRYQPLECKENDPLWVELLIIAVAVFVLLPIMLLTWPLKRAAQFVIDWL